MIDIILFCLAIVAMIAAGIILHRWTKIPPTLKGPDQAATNRSQWEEFRRTTDRW